MDGASPDEVAYWYPQPFWRESSAGMVKNLLPFFDQVAILLPGYMHGRHRDANPWLTGPLEDAGLLTVLDPGEFIDEQMGSWLFETMHWLLERGAFEDLEIPTERWGYHELSRTRLGWDVDLTLSQELVADLEARRLALPSEDGVSVPLHPVVRTTVLVLLAQLAPPTGRARGLRLVPVTDEQERIQDLVGVLRLPPLRQAGQVVIADSEAVGIDLSSVALDEILGFRSDHGAQCRGYLRSVRDHVRTLGAMHPSEREEATADRQEELRDLAADLRGVSQQYWKRPTARAAIGAAGAILTLKSGSLVPGALAAMYSMLEFDGEPEAPAPFSYLFEVQRGMPG